MGTLRLAASTTYIRRTLALDGRGTSYLTTYIPVEEVDDETGKAVPGVRPVTLSCSRDGTIRIHGPVAFLFAELGEVADLPAGVGIDLPRTPPPTSQDGMMLSVQSVQSVLTGGRVDIARLHAALVVTFRTFVAFPAGGEATPDDYAAYLACYVLSTYLLPAFAAVGYIWLTGLAGSGKSTAAHVAARLAHLPLIASASSTLASLRGHADAGGTLILDNFDTINNKDDTTKALRSFWEIGYMHGASVTLQVPAKTGKGWQTERANVYANRVATAVAEPPDALDSRCVKVMMFRTDDTTKGALSPWDDENWADRPHDLVQRCWTFALFHLADAAKIVRTITTANTGLTNRDLQVWRPALTVARIVDLANGDTAAWEAVTRLTRWLLVQRADDDGSRESYVTRALLAIAGDGHISTTTSLTLSMVRKLYAEDHGEPPGTGDEREKRAEDATPFGLDNVKKLGNLFKRMGVPKLPRTSKGFQYDIGAPVLTRLKALYLPPALPLTVSPISTPSAQTAHSTFDPAWDDGWDVEDVENADDVETKGDADSFPNVNRADDEAVATGTVTDDLVLDAWDDLIRWANAMHLSPFTDEEREAAEIVGFRLLPDEPLTRAASRIFEGQRAWREMTVSA